MRRILITVLTLILIGGLAIMMISGVNIGNLQILSIKGISNENENLDTQIDELGSLINNDYQTAKTNLDNSFKELQKSKQKYLNMITYSTEDEIKAANQTEKYEIGFLWTKIGLYATRNNVEMQANVSASSISGLYNISFTATGEYINISEFVYAIENDAKLGFKIEKFTLVNFSGDILKATFTIRHIAIDEKSLTTASLNIETNTNNGNTQ